MDVLSESSYQNNGSRTGWMPQPEPFHSFAAAVHVAQESTCRDDCPWSINCNCHQCFTALRSLRREAMSAYQEVVPFTIIDSTTSQSNISRQTALSDQAHMHVIAIICPLTLKGS